MTASNALSLRSSSSRSSSKSSSRKSSSKSNKSSSSKNRSGSKSNKNKNRKGRKKKRECPKNEREITEDTPSNLYDNDNVIYGRVPITSDDTESAMEKCCGDKKVKSWDNGCKLICELPDSLRDTMMDREWNASRALGDCLDKNTPSNSAKGVVSGSSLEDLKRAKDNDDSGASVIGGVPSMASLYLLLIVMFFFQRR